VGISSWEGLTGSFGGDGPELAALRNWVPGYRVKAWTRALQRFGVDDPPLAHQLAHDLARERSRHHVAYEDAEPVLRALVRDHRLALVTNGAPEIQREKLRASGLARWFQAVVVSAEIGVGKPEPKIFRTALDAVGVSADATAMVGDSLIRDITGAKRAGIRAIWLNRFEESREEGIEPEAEIRGLRELPGVLA
jgi:putative hydrolase of the HAD superfamily